MRDVGGPVARSTKAELYAEPKRIVAALNKRIHTTIDACRHSIFVLHNCLFAQWITMWLSLAHCLSLRCSEWQRRCICCWQYWFLDDSEFAPAVSCIFLGSAAHIGRLRASVDCASSACMTVKHSYIDAKQSINSTAPIIWTISIIICLLIRFVFV